jgi:hypothetical protein
MQTLEQEAGTIEIPVETPAQAETFIEDGYIIDAETGEVLGMVDAIPFSDDATYTEKKNLVQWALKRRADAVALGKAKKLHMETLIAGIRERFETQVAEQDRKVAWIDQCYEPLMKEVCRTEIEGTTKKSVKLDWGTLKFVASKGKVEVDDPAGAALELFDEGMQYALRVTLDASALYAAAEGGDIEAKRILSAMPNMIRSETDGEKLVSVTPVPGVSFQVMASAFTEEIPEGLQYIRRAKPEDPLGKFGVSH